MRILAVATYPAHHLALFFQELAEQHAVDLHVLYALPPGPEIATAGDWRSPSSPAVVHDGYSWAPVVGVEQSEAGTSIFSGLSAPTIRAQLEQAGPDAVLVTGWQSKVLVQAARAARSLRIPVLLRGESNDLRRRPFWVRLAHRWYFRKFSAFLAIGKANRRLYESAGVPSDRIFDVPYAVDNERFAQAAASLRPRRTELREGWNVDGATFCALFAGKLQAKKRPGDLLDALELARKSHGDLRLLVAGSGELETELKQKAKERRLPVTFTGFLNQSEMPMAYAAADALVLPSDAGETWGLVVNEAMASGLPAIISDRVGCREDLVVDGSTGFSFSMGDTRALAACISSLAADPIRASAMGEAARQRVEQEYSIERAVSGTLAALESVKRFAPS